MCRFLAAICVALTLVLVPPAYPAAGAGEGDGVVKEAADGCDKYVVLDPDIVERSEGVSVVLGMIEKEPRNPLFVEDKSWEVRFDNLYANVMFDQAQGLYRVWYSPFIMDEVTSSTPPDAREGVPYKPGKREMGVCYAVSKDGLRWEKPNLGIVEFDGSTANNIVMRHVHGSGVFRDPRDPDPERRYKAFLQKGIATSPDGLHWTGLIPCPEIEAQGDTHNNALWVADAGKYVGITRLWGDGQRIVGRTESTDYRRWTKAVEVLRGDERWQTYAMPVFAYAQGYLGLVMVFDTKQDVVDCELAWSADTVEWDRIRPGTPLIPRGPVGCFDSHCIYAAAYPVILPDEIRLYYGGSNGPHTAWRDGGLGLARLRPDGFAGLRAEGTGAVVTIPVVCSGSRLRVSADAAVGAIRVAVLGAEGLGADSCTSLTGNVTDAPVSWGVGHGLGGLRGTTIQLRFELESATLYSFSFSD